jgi:hypothetical protein
VQGGIVFIGLVKDPPADPMMFLAAMKGEQGTEKERERESERKRDA